MVTVRLRSLAKDVTLELCVSDFPWEKPRKEIREIKFKGYPRTLVPFQEEIQNMPKILLGVRAALLLPRTLPEELVPPAFWRKWPGLEVFKSKMTGRLIFAGMLSCRDGPYACGGPRGPYSIPMLAFTAKGERR